MRQFTHVLRIDTRGKGLYEFTAPLARWVEACGAGAGLLTLFVRHTSASLLIQENADPDVRHDLEAFFARLVPEGDARYQHRLEGPDDMPAHIRSALTQTHLAIPIMQGRLALGTWQGVYLYEHRRAPQQREVVAHLLSD